MIPFRTLCSKLRAAIKAAPAGEHEDLRIRVSAGRLLAGQRVNAADFLRLCARLGVDPLTGEPRTPIEGPQDVALYQISIGLRMHRSLNNLPLRTVASRTNISAPTILRLERNMPVSAHSIIAVCDFIGVHPFHYMQNEKRRAA
jgi:hypothetical protein